VIKMDDPANYYPAVMILTIVGVAMAFAIWILWLERRDKDR